MGSGQSKFFSDFFILFNLTRPFSRPVVAVDAGVEESCVRSVLE